MVIAFRNVHSEGQANLHFLAVDVCSSIETDDGLNEDSPDLPGDKKY